MSDYCMIETAFGDKEELEQAVNKLLNCKLVSSCQVIESSSKWNWKNAREESKEYLVFIKTKKELIKKVFDTIKNIHSYECFEFAIFDLTSCNKEYLKWIDEETDSQ